MGLVRLGPPPAMAERLRQDSTDEEESATPPRLPRDRPQHEEDAFQAVVYAANCTLYESDPGPRADGMTFRIAGKSPA
jgi:hypothetical protein